MLCYAGHECFPLTIIYYSFNRISNETKVIMSSIFD